MFKIEHKLFKITLLMIVLSVLMIGCASAMSGSGTQGDPYIIETSQDLQDISNNPASYYELGNSISMSGFTFTPISSFSGNLNGNGYTISNLNSALINNIASGGVITNVIFDNSQVDNSGNAGALAMSSSGTASYITVKNSKITGSNSAGGIIGYGGEACYVDSCIVENSVVMGATSGDYGTGGIIGTQDPKYSNTAVSVNNCTIRDSYLRNSKVGGIVGFKPNTVDTSSGIGEIFQYLVINDCNVENCYLYGTQGGGLIGGRGIWQGSLFTSKKRHSDWVLNNCTAIGSTVYTTDYVAGLVGYAGYSGTRSSAYSVAGVVYANDCLIDCCIIYGTGNAYPFSESGGSGNSIIRNSNFYGSTIGGANSLGTVESSVENVQNEFMKLQSLSYSPLEESEATKTLTWQKWGSSLQYDNNQLTNHYSISENGNPTELSGGNTLTKTYSAGTYTDYITAGYVLPTSMSTLTTLTSNQITFTVSAGQVLPTITNVAVNKTDFYQTGSEYVLLSATITAPEGHDVTSIQWQYSSNNITFNDISGATTSNSVWNIPVGTYYVRVLATNADGTTISDVITVNAYGLATITYDYASPVNVELNGSIQLNASFIPSTNPHPSTVYRWVYSIDGIYFYSFTNAGVANTSKVLNESGVKYICFTVGDAFTNTYVFGNLYTIDVQPAEIVSINANKTNVALNEHVLLTGTIENQYNETHKWQVSTNNISFSDISGATGMTLELNNDAVGSKYYRFVSTNAFNTYVSNTISVNVYGAPTVSATVSPLTANLSDTITLTGNVIVNPVLGDNDYTVQWKYSSDDGVSWNNVIGGNVLSTTTSFSDYGSYKIKLTVSDNYYTVDSSISIVNIVSVPTIVSSSAIPSELGDRQTVTLNSSISSITGTHTTQWEYTINDGYSWENVPNGNVDNLIWTPAGAGYYKVRVSAQNTYGTGYGALHPVTVYGEVSVVITGNQTEIGEGDYVGFNAVITNASVQSPYTIDWKYRNSSSDWAVFDINVNQTSKQFNTAGAYSVMCVVTDDYFITQSNILNITVYSPPIVSINAPFINDGKVGDTLTLTGSVLSELPATKQWSYRNVNTSSSAVIPYSDVFSYDFTLPVGAYEITLTATNSVGSSSATYDYLYFYGSPSISMNAIPSSVSVGDDITLTSEVVVNETLGKSDYISYYQYKNNNVWTNCSSPFTVLSEGSYEFRAVVNDEYYTVYSSIKTVDCANAPVVSGNTDVSTVAVGSEISLVGNIVSSIPITAYNWQTYQNGEWNNISTSVSYGATYTLNTAGEYVFRLMGANSRGTSYSSNVSVTAVDARSITASISSQYTELGDSIDISASITTPQYVSPIYSQGWQISTNNGITWDNMGISSLNATYTPQYQGTYNFRYKIVDTLGVISLSNVISSLVGNTAIIELGVPYTAENGANTTFKAYVNTITPITYNEWFVDNVSIGAGEGSNYEITHVFWLSGTHTVKFMAENSFGISYETQNVQVISAPSVSNVSILYDTIEFGEQQEITFKSNVNNNQLTIQEKYLDTGAWRNTNAQITFVGDTFTGKWTPYTDGSHGGTMYARVIATNDVGSNISDAFSFTVGGKQPTVYEKTFEAVDSNAQIVMIIAGLVMLVIVGILIMSIISGNIEIATAVKAFFVLGAVVVVLTFVVIFVGSMAGVITLAL